MGQSLVNSYQHIIFSTKNRLNLIHPPFDAELYKYIGGVCKSLKCQPINVGGYLNHVHILCMQSKDITMIELLKKVKASSSKWMKTTDKSNAKFYWQNGYGAFSVSPNHVNAVSDYIKKQKEHHSTKSFKEEYLLFLKKYQVDFDEKYLWD